MKNQLFIAIGVPVAFIAGILYTDWQYRGVPVSLIYPVHTQNYTKAITEVAQCASDAKTIVAYNSEIVSIVDTLMNDYKHGMPLDQGRYEDIYNLQAQRQKFINSIYNLSIE